MERNFTELEIAQIEFISYKLKNSVRQLDIMSWLQNFKSYEWRDMLNLLSLMEFVTPSELFETYVDLFEKIKGTLKKNTTMLVVYIGEFGKSGSQMMYYANKALEHLKCKYKLISDVRVIPDTMGKIKGISTLVFIDDYLGSGESFVKYFVKNKQVWSSYNFSSIYVAVVASMTSAVAYIEGRVPNVKVHTAIKRDMIFRDNAKLFSTDEELKRTRNICYQYGSSLYNKDHALGYNNSQAVITFPYGAPNNTLPIIWSSKMFGYKKWRPLFSRFVDDKVQYSKHFRKEVAHWIGIARMLGYRDLLNGESKGYIGKHNFRVFGFLKLVEEGRDISVVCHLLGLYEADFEDLLEDSIKLNYIMKDENGMLRIGEEGSKVLVEVRKRVEKVRVEELKQKSLEFNPVSYIPITLRGLT